MSQSVFRRVPAVLAVMALVSVGSAAPGSASDSDPFGQLAVTGDLRFAYFGIDPGKAVINNYGTEEGVDQGWFVREGETQLSLSWNVQALAEFNQGYRCTPDVRIDGVASYIGAALVPERTAGTEGPQIIFFQGTGDAGFTGLAGPGFAAATSVVGKHSVDVSVDCATLGAARWSGTLFVSPRSPGDRDAGVSVNDGDDFTKNKSVKLFLGWAGIGRVEGMIDRVRISNDGGFAPSKTKEYELVDGKPIKWNLVQLGSERIPRTVYVRFHEAGGKWLRQTFTDDILLDTIKPKVVAARVVGTATSTSQVLAAKRATLRIKAKDNRSGVRSMQVATKRKKNKQKVRKYKRKTVVRGGGKVFVRVRDGAGNWSKWRRAR